MQKARQMTEGRKGGIAGRIWIFTGR